MRKRRSKHLNLAKHSAAASVPTCRRVSSLSAQRTATEKTWYRVHTTCRLSIGLSATLGRFVFHMLFVENCGLLLTVHVFDNFPRLSHVLSHLDLKLRVLDAQKPTVLRQLSPRHVARQFSNSAPQATTQRPPPPPEPPEPPELLSLPYRDGECKPPAATTSVATAITATRLQR